MNQTKTVPFNKLIIVMSAITLCFINLLTDLCIVQIASHWFFWMIVVFIMKGDFFHPYVWYLGAHTLYHTAYPILYFLNLRTNRGYSGEPLLMAAVAALVFVMVIPGNHNSGEIISKPSGYSAMNRKLLHTLTIVITVSAFAIKALGYANKKEVYSSSSFFSAVLSIVLIYINVFTIESCFSLCVGDKIDKPLTAEILIATLSITLFTGERDLLLRLLLVLILMFFYFGKISKKSLTILLIGFVFLIPLSWQFKYYFLSGQITERDYSNGLESIIYNFLSGEFESASRNLQNLVNNKEITYGIMGGKTFISDITRVVGYAPYSSLRWHQSTFYANSSTGQGFTLIGEGYINFGYWGIVIVYLIVGLILRYLYLNCRNNIYTLFMYINSIPIFIYANRADLSNIYSPFVRHILLSVLIYYFLNNRIQWKKN